MTKTNTLGHNSSVDEGDKEDDDEGDDEDEDEGDDEDDDASSNYDSGGVGRSLLAVAAIKSAAINLCRRHRSCNKSRLNKRWHIPLSKRPHSSGYSYNRSGI